MSQFTDSSVCSSGGDAFLQINLAQAEVVYVDTFRSPSGAPLAQLSFIDSCGQSTTCASNACAGTGNGAGQSQIVRWLTAGTHYLVVDAPTSTSTPVRVTIQHFPATSANGMALMNPGDFNISGTTTGGSQSLATCGAGPDQTYFWTTCPSSQGGAFNASLCSGASFDTVLQQLNGNGMFGGCNNNDFYCSPQSSISVSVPGGAGLHAFIVDGASSSSAGAFTAQVTRP